MTDLVKIARGFTLVDDDRTHYPGCERDHTECLIQRMANELERRDRAFKTLRSVLQEGA